MEVTEEQGSMESEIMVQNTDFKEIRVTFPYNSSFIKRLKQLMDESGILKKILLLRLKGQEKTKNYLLF